MQLALSGRLWETSQGYTSTLMEQLSTAASMGYQGIEIRYPLLPSGDAIGAVRDELRRLGLTTVFSPVAGMPTDDESRFDVIRVLDTLQQLGTPYVKAIGATTEDYDRLREIADLAGERGIKATTQLHSNSLCDTVERTEKCLTEINHPNLGLIFDAAHLPFANDPDVDGAVRRLRPWIDLVNVQSYAPAETDQSGRQRVTINDRDWVIAMPGEPDGVDLAAYMNSLKTAGFDGWVTVMPAVDPTMDPNTVARQYYDFLSPLLA
jgi:sugar phosphate isomerase/epimerase